MNEELKWEISLALSLHSGYCPKYILSLLDGYESVDLVIKAIDYANRKTHTLDKACNILYKSQAFS